MQSNYAPREVRLWRAAFSCSLVYAAILSFNINYFIQFFFNSHKIFLLLWVVMSIFNYFIFNYNETYLSLYENEYYKNKMSYILAIANIIIGLCFICLEN
jgi:hypothetical protein